MREKILNAIFGEWCEGDFNKKSKRKIDTVLQEVSTKLHLSDIDKLYVEENIMQVACTCEEVGFKNGFLMCVDLFTGNLLKEKGM